MIDDGGNLTLVSYSKKNLPFLGRQAFFGNPPISDTWLELPATRHSIRYLLKIIKYRKQILGYGF